MLTNKNNSKYKCVQNKTSYLICIYFERLWVCRIDFNHLGKVIFHSIHTLADTWTKNVHSAESNIVLFTEIRPKFLVFCRCEFHLLLALRHVWIEFYSAHNVVPFFFVFFDFFLIRWEETDITIDNKLFIECRFCLLT